MMKPVQPSTPNNLPQALTQRMPAMSAIKAVTVVGAVACMGMLNSSQRIRLPVVKGPRPQNKTEGLDAAIHLLGRMQIGFGHSLWNPSH